jgi:hypothetical protein
MRPKMGPPVDRYWPNPGYESGDLGPKGPKRGPRNGPKMGQKVVKKGSKMGTLKPVHVVHFCCKMTGFWGNFTDFGPFFGALFARGMPRARGFGPKGPKKGFQKEGSEMAQKGPFQTGSK